MFCRVDGEHDVSTWETIYFLLENQGYKVSENFKSDSAMSGWTSNPGQFLFTLRLISIRIATADGYPHGVCSSFYYDYPSYRNPPHVPELGISTEHLYPEAEDLVCRLGFEPGPLTWYRRDDSH